MSRWWPHKAVRIFWVRVPVATAPVASATVPIPTSNPCGGQPFWSYVQPLPRSLPLCCGAVNRGVAVGNGLVFFGSLDAQVVALDARTGQKVWQTSSGSIAEGYSYTVAPQVIGDRVIMAISGGDFGARCFIDAYHVKSGERLWRFWTVPGPGEAGHDTWAGDSWKQGGGAAWMPVTYDKDSLALPEKP